jgi:addiction module RelE/StbE family toxin
MIEIAFGSSFKRSFKRSIKGNISHEKKFWECLEIFMNNPFEPKLKTHKLSGKLKDLWSFSIEYDIRVVFYFESDNKVVLTDIGSHHEVY